MEGHTPNDSKSNIFSKKKIPKVDPPGSFLMNSWRRLLPPPPFPTGNYHTFRRTAEIVLTDALRSLLLWGESTDLFHQTKPVPDRKTRSHNLATRDPIEAKSLQSKRLAGW